MNKIKGLISLLLVFVLMTAAPLAEQAAEDPVVAMIGEEQLLVSDVEYYAQQLAAYGYIETVDDVKTTVEYALRNFLMPRAKVAELGIENILSDKYSEYYEKAQAEFEAALESYVAFFGGSDADEEARAALRQEAEEYYAAEGYDREGFVKEMMPQYAFDVLMDSLDIEVTEEQVQAEYDAAVAQYESYFANEVGMYEMYVNYYGYDIPFRPYGYRGVLHILLTASDELTEAYANAEDEEAKAAAAEAVIASLRDKIDDINARLDAGEEFTALIAEYNEDPGMAGDTLKTGYPVHKDSLVYVQEFTDGAFSEKMQKPGDVSDPVVSDFGVHIIQYLTDIEGGAEPMSEDARQSIEEYLISMAQSEQIEKWLGEYEVVYTDTYYAMLGQ